MQQTLFGTQRIMETTKQCARGARLFDPSQTSSPSGRFLGPNNWLAGTARQCLLGLAQLGSNLVRLLPSGEPRCVDSGGKAFMQHFMDFVDSDAASAS